MSTLSGVVVSKALGSFLVVVRRLLVMFGSLVVMFVRFGECLSGGFGR
ncbi:hypothetical protein IHE49_17710 [Rhodanobacter sp. 7MK24]|nr:hypothetical protein [Rhodanobacter sp. 7MK24]MBD8882322.1 hypothetical protein [Rhodanobacter sp. 7MK24]